MKKDELRKRTKEFSFAMKKWFILFSALALSAFCRMAVAATNIYTGGGSDGYDDWPRGSLGISSLQINNANGATGITVQAAWLNGTLTKTDAVSTVYAYYGTNDGGTVTADWNYSTNLGEKAVGDLTVNVTGLIAGVVHYYRFYGTNANGEAWAWPAASFETYPAAVVDNASGATNITDTSAFLNGTLTSTWSAATTVRVYWGKTDGTNNKAIWGNTNDFGVRAEGSLTTNVTELSTLTTYYYRFYATNVYGEVWAASSSTFPTLGLPEVQADGATYVRSVSAQLNGTLTTGGVADVTIYWGQDTNNWASTNGFGDVSQDSSFSTNITGLSDATMYYYVCYATNANGEDWSAIDSFITVNSAIFAGGSSDGYDDNWADTTAQTGLPQGTMFVIE